MRLNWCTMSPQQPERRSIERDLAEVGAVFGKPGPLDDVVQEYALRIERVAFELAELRASLHSMLQRQSRTDRPIA